MDLYYVLYDIIYINDLLKLNKYDIISFTDDTTAICKSINGYEVNNDAKIKFNKVNDWLIEIYYL